MKISPNPRTSARSREYLRRVVAAGLEEGFQYVSVLGPLERMQYVCGFQALVDHGFVEQVAESCGRWHYRLTDAGRAEAALALSKPRRKGVSTCTTVAT